MTSNKPTPLSAPFWWLLVGLAITVLGAAMLHPGFGAMLLGAIIATTAVLIMTHDEIE